MNYDNEVFGVYIGPMTDKAQEYCLTSCSNYRDLNDKIMDMSIELLLTCIEFERKNKCRANILNRLYSRFTELRKNEERRELYQRD